MSAGRLASGAVDVFDLRERLIEEYRSYSSSFVRIADPDLRGQFEAALDDESMWPHPMLALNPSFEPGGTIDELAAAGVLHPDAAHVFRIGKSQRDPRGRRLVLHRHQAEAIKAAQAGRNYLLTTGTGSGKSLAYIIPIVDHVLRTGSGQGPKAVVVYPMNALANSQMEELDKFLKHGPWGDRPPVTYQRYTGQERDEAREAILAEPPDILLTNYVMLELILTRVFDRRLREQFGNLRFLVLDELHTYRGRQGSDVAMLVRRVRQAAARAAGRGSAPRLLCVGTSATLSSEGSPAERQARLAAVASELFGDKVADGDVIGETLRRSTRPLAGTEGERAGLIERVRNPGAAPTDPDGFKADPLSAWIETVFGVAETDDGCSEQAEPPVGLVEPGVGGEQDTDGGRLERAEPLAIDGPGGGAGRLSEQTGLGDEACARAIRYQLMAGQRIKDPATQMPVFAFRLHQFLSRGDTAWATPELPGVRATTLQQERFVAGDPSRNRAYLPLAFCRECGQDYYVVERVPSDTGPRLKSRDLGDRPGDDEPGHASGFFYLSADNPWPDDPREERERLPPDWLDHSGALRPARRDQAPDAWTVRPDGSLSRPAELDGYNAGAEPTAPGGVPGPGLGPGLRPPVTGHWVPAPFRFCLNCGVSYANARGTDFSRLTELGAGGRSTATTIMSLAAIRRLREAESLSPEARKLLSFTDNRQDASLQAAHFNDFVQVTMLRSALYRAAAAAGPAGLAHDELARRVFDELGLPWESYAREPELAGPARGVTDRTLRDVLAYRLYRDLQRGWRVTQPNLEQTGLLEIDYENLPELLDDAALWTGGDCPAALRQADRDTRERILRTLLDRLRTDLVLRVDVLDSGQQEGLKRRSDQHLAGPWALDPDDRRLEEAREMLTRSRNRNDWNRVFLSARSAYGQFLRRSSVLGGAGCGGGPRGRLTLEDTEAIIAAAVGRLRRYGLLTVVGDDGAGCSRYQIPASALRWRAGDGTGRRQDLLATPNAPEGGFEPNRFFVDLYRNLAPEPARMEAREHTAQVSAAERQQREREFRRAELPVLFCSPTMELGVDIADLNVVNMRNVPPTPANYAQRSGRAGRSGQPALVFTYCSVGSSHDQHYFDRPELMVAGQVDPPRLDLANEDLVRAHVHSVWLTESDLNLGNSMRDVLDLDDDSDHPDFTAAVQAALADAGTRSRALHQAAAVLAEIGSAAEPPGWWTDEWLPDTLAAVPRRFADAMRRWRTLYAAARQQARAQSEVVQSASASPQARNRAKRLRDEAERQLEILRSDSVQTGQSDFYPYRYLASEGFLPGYSFPRLPLSAFVPGRRGPRSGPEYLQRPRFLAISEFGPRGLIYHEGAQYEINRVILPVPDAAEAGPDGAAGGILASAKRCRACGYVHQIDAPPGPDVCEYCGAELPAAMPNLLRMQNVSTVRRRRITSDEEERRRMGYELQSGLRFSRRHQRPLVRRAELADEAGAVLLRLAYGDAAVIWRANLGLGRRRDTTPPGFRLNLETGQWARAADRDNADGDGDENRAEEPESGRFRRVIPFVTDFRNALLIEPAEGIDLDLEAMATLQAALKSAMETVLGVESSELAAEPLPSAGDRRMLLFYESAEGGAGVLRRLVDDGEPDLWHRIAAAAMRRCHFDPATGADDPDDPHPCEAACYKCLLSYYNQPDHGLLDRALVTRTRVVSALLGCRVVPQHRQGFRFDSRLEEQFIERLEQGGYRLPGASQVFFEQAGTRPDFAYHEACTVIYVDGPHHDFPERRQRDLGADAAMADLGYKVIRFGHRDDWAEIIAAHPDVFGPGRSQAP